MNLFVIVEAGKSKVRALTDSLSGEDGLPGWLSFPATSHEGTRYLSYGRKDKGLL